MFRLHHTLIRWIGSFLSDRSLPSDWTAFSLICTQSMMLYPRDLSSALCSSLSYKSLLAAASSSIHSFADDTFLRSSFLVDSHNTIPMTISHSIESSQPPFLPIMRQLFLRWGKDNLVSFNRSKTIQVAISHKHNQSFSPVLMNGDELDTSASFPQLGLSLSSNLTRKTHIHSLAKHASQRLGFLARGRGCLSSSQLLTICMFQIRLSLGSAPTSGLLLQYPLSVFLTKSSPKPFVSSTTLTSPNLSNHFPIVL